MALVETDAFTGFVPASPSRISLPAPSLHHDAFTAAVDISTSRSGTPRTARVVQREISAEPARGANNSQRR